MQLRHSCSDFKCPVCSPRTAEAFKEGLRVNEAQAESFYLKLEAARTEIAALKAEVERLSSAFAQECRCKSAIYICKDCGHQSLGYECKRCLNEAELTRERERSEKLAAVLRDELKGHWQDCGCQKCRLLAAKRDEGEEG